MENSKTLSQLTSETLAGKELRDYKTAIKGNLLLPGDKDYEKSRKVWNGMIDRRPVMITKCHNKRDIQKALEFARNHELSVSVKGGGHHVAGTAVLDQGMMIDLSDMKDIRIDLESRSVIVQPGVTWAELDKETEKHHFAVPGGVVSSTGVAGLTLGGGMGWLRRKYGLSCDNLLSAEVISARGEILQVNEHSHSDLFWAIRGGGGGYGIVSSFHFKLCPLPPEVMVCMVFYPATETKKILEFYRELAPTLVEEASTFLIYGTLPDEPFIPKESHGEDYLLIAGMYAGDKKQGERVFQPLRKISKPIADLSGPIKYTVWQTNFDADYPKEKLNYYWKSLFLNELSDQSIEKFIELGKNRPSKLTTVDIWQLGGAIDKVRPSESAYPHRNSGYLLGIESNWEKHLSNDKNIAWTRLAVKNFLSLSEGHSYLNFEDEGPENLKAALGRHHLKLQEIKRQYDPDHILF
ncbi:FAD-binding oxidoreductase [Cyclobacterium sp. SYSU L10401]|uniref:FAD-binding oxidoreductase n=1 Tax=Cyclobacterium sp. SYSU L10401 TaxID=2678657 RepID=UPI0013D519E4|nr:FAD-binding oxidoreductase [Cyclobacterium sp. SYSU L10401]